MYDSSIPFSAEEINLIEGSGLTVDELRNFFERFPDQNLDTAIGGCLDEKKAKEAGDVTALDASHDANPDVKTNETPTSE